MLFHLIFHKKNSEEQQILRRKNWFPDCLQYLEKGFEEKEEELGNLWLKVFEGKRYQQKR